MKKIAFMLCVLLTPLYLVGCASTKYVRNPADYNGDGFISDAEWQQYNRRQQVRGYQLREQQAEEARKAQQQQQFNNTMQMLQQYNSMYGK